MSSFTVNPISDPMVRSSVCEAIIRSLPEWFGIKQANQEYVRSAAELSSLAVSAENQVVGLLVYKPVFEIELNKQAFDIHFLGIFPAFRRIGLGRRLVEALVAEAGKEKIPFLTVETLDPDVGDKSYAETFRFYRSLGFEVHRKFQYDEWNRMVRMNLPLNAQINSNWRKA